MTKLIKKRLMEEKPLSTLNKKFIVHTSSKVSKDQFWNKHLQENPFSIDPDTIFFSDLHLHDRKEFSRIDPTTGLNTRLTEGLNILDQIILILTEHPKINKVYNLGDVFELKDRVPNHILIEFKERMEDITSRVKLVSLMGNHDFNIQDYPILSLFDWEGSKFINKAGWDGEIYFIPFQRYWEDFRRNWIEIHKQAMLKPTIICIHQDIPNAVYETGKQIDGIWDLKTDPDILYISGHLHKPQKVHGIQFLGSPYPIRFSDEDSDRYIWLYNSETKQLKPIQLNYSKFVSLEYYGLDFPKKEDLKPIVNNNYVRIIGKVRKEDISNNDRIKIKSELEKLGAKVVVFQTQIEFHSQSKIPNHLIGKSKQEQDKEIIIHYAEENQGNLDLEKLTEMGISVYEDSLN